VLTLQQALEKTANGFVLNALPYVENEEYFHEG